MAARRSGTTQHTCMKCRFGNGAVVNGVLQPISGKRSSFSGCHGIISVVSKFGHGDPFQQTSAGWTTSR